MAGSTCFIRHSIILSLVMTYVLTNSRHYSRDQQGSLQVVFDRGAATTEMLCTLLNSEKTRGCLFAWAGERCSSALVAFSTCIVFEAFWPWAKRGVSEVNCKMIPNNAYLKLNDMMDRGCPSKSQLTADHSNRRPLLDTRDMHGFSICSDSAPTPCPTKDRDK
jgi:hypothetical protein